MNLKQCRWDDGIDIEIGSNKPTFGNLYFRNLYVNLQVKSTEDWQVSSDGTIAYALKASNYEQLREPCFPPSYLVLYTLPHARAHWVVNRDNLCEFRNSAFFLSLRGQPALVARSDGRQRYTRTVRVPTKNRLTAMSLLGLYRQACEQSIEFGGVP